MLFFEFPENASWNDKRDCVEFSVILGPYEGTVRVPRRVFQGLLDQRPTPERCIEAFHLQRTRFEMIAERKLRRRQLTDDGNVEITGCDLREKTPPVGKAAYSREPRRVELREQLRRPLATIAKNKVVGEIVDEDPDRWSQSSAGREYKMKGNFLRAPTGEYPNQASFSDRSHGNFSR